mgnify:CR=1 FL=1
MDVLIRLLKQGTLLHHHAAIDVIVQAYTLSGDGAILARRLVEEVGSAGTVLRCAHGAHAAYLAGGGDQFL